MFLGLELTDDKPNFQFHNFKNSFQTFAAPHPTAGEHFSHFEPTFSGIDLDTGRFQIFMKTEGLIEERDE